MLWLYRILFPFVALVLAPGYLLRMRRRGGYRANFAQRFGALPALPPKRTGVPRVWLQAVSVGEMLAIGPILEGLRRDGAGIVLDVQDSGAGIAESERERVFEPFYQVRGSARGTGLGLALVRRIARLHGGEAQVVADAPSSCLRVRLPASTPT